MNKKTVLAAVLACCLFWFNPANAYSLEKKPVFRDIRGSFAEQAIVRLAKQGFIHGINSDQYAPGDNITRLQFAVLVAKTLGVQPYFPPQPGFSDISPGTLAAGYAEALANLGLVNGTGDRLFGGASPISRQDAAVILSKALGDTADGGVVNEFQYKDTGRISPYALKSVAYATAKGWFSGNRGYFYPLKNLTRAEAAVLVDRLLQARREQARTAIQSSDGVLQVEAGQTKKIETPAAKSPVAFTPVLGIDNPAICSLSAADATVAGRQPGTATLTVNAGSSSHPVKVQISKSESGFTPQEDNGDATAGGDLRVSYAVYEHLPDSGFKKIESQKYPRPAEGLLSQSDTWTGFFRQHGRDIIVDLGQFTNVTGVSLEFMQNAGWGITLPDYLNGAVSADGVSWYQLGRVYHSIGPFDKNEHRVTLSLAFPPVTARYLKLSFPVDIFVFARHLTVQRVAPAASEETRPEETQHGEIQPGNNQPSETLPGETQPRDIPAGYISAGETPVILAPVEETESTGAYLQDPDIEDILLLFTGDQTRQQTFTGNDFLPLLAYLDRQGKIKGRMFDTMLFLPNNRLPCTRASWDSYLNDLFASGKQLHALEETVAQTSCSAGMPKKEKVILTIPYPDSNQPYFDDKLSFAAKNITKEHAAENRFEAIKWYYNELIDKWNRAGFKNLDLAGMYWYSESVNNTVYQEAYLVRQTAQMVAGNNQKFFWIPYYGAQGFTEWQSYGFTHVMIQPNYYATQTPPDDRMQRAAEMAGKYGAGIEIELDNRALYDPYYAGLFQKELQAAHQFGLDRNAVNAYYVGLKGTLLDAVYSDIPEFRKVYDDLYKWISGSYK